MKKGIRVFVMTRKSTDHSGAMVEQAEKSMKMLESLGVFVLPLSGKVHQKYAIIDREIMWEGSLNIFSQRDSSETMRRIEGVNTIDQFMEFHRLVKNLGEMGSNNLIHCEFCREPGSYYWTGSSIYGGIWTFCLTNGHAQGKKPKSAAEKAAASEAREKKKQDALVLRKKIKLNSDKQPVCPMHDRTMKEKTGRFGIYWECPLAKECGCKANQKQLKHLGL